jgi:hypothetical protein
MNLDSVPEVEFVLFEVGAAIEKFFKDCTNMTNADFDIGEVVNSYVEYRRLGIKSLLHYDNYGTTLDDREDGRVLFSACESLYNELNYRMKTIDGNVVKAILQPDDSILIVEVHYENTYPGVSGDRGSSRKTGRFI